MTRLPKDLNKDISELETNQSNRFLVKILLYGVMVLFVYLNFEKSARLKDCQIENVRQKAVNDSLVNTVIKLQEFKGAIKWKDTVALKTIGL